MTNGGDLQHTHRGSIDLLLFYDVMSRWYLSYYRVLVLLPVHAYVETKFGTYCISGQNIGSGSDSQAYEITKPACASVECRM